MFRLVYIVSFPRIIANSSEFCKKHTTEIFDIATIKIEYMGK